MLVSGIVWYVVFVFSTVLHECAHAWVAHRTGDDTPYRTGTLTLNPLPHIQRSPMGMVLVPLLSFVMQHGGWMIGWASVPYSRVWAQRRPGAHALMAAAGPGANFALVALAFVAIKVLLGAGLLTVGTGESLGHLVAAPAGAEDGPLGALAMLLSVTLALNTVLGVFNLIPVPPLDGQAIAGWLIPPLRRLYDLALVMPVYQLIGLVLAWQLSEHLVGPALHLVLAFLF